MVRICMYRPLASPCKGSSLIPESPCLLQLSAKWQGNLPRRGGRVIMSSFYRADISPGCRKGCWSSFSHP